MFILKSKLNNLFKDGFFHILFGGTMSKMIAFLSSIVIVRLVDKSSYAALAYADNIYFYITLFAGFGMSSAILKFCVNDDERINRAYYVFAFMWGTIIQCFMLALMLWVVSMMQLPFAGVSELIYFLMPYGILYYWFSLFQSFLRTRFENKKYAKSSFIQVLLTFLFSLLFVSLYGIKGIACARTLAIIGSIFIFSSYIKKYLKSFDRYKLSKKEIQPFLMLAVSFLISNVFSMVMPANETFLVNNLIKNEIVSANYKVASLIPSQLPFITSTIMIYFFPLFAKKKKDRELWFSVKKVGVYTFLLNLVIATVGMVFTPIIIKIAYGDTYSDANYLSAVLWVVYFLNAGFRMVPMNILPALGYIKFNVILSVLSSIIHFIVDYFFIVSWGINGAVFATAIIYAGSGLLYWVYLYKKCKEIN